MNQNKVGAYITACRKEKQMTQSDLAKALNVSIQAVSKWERGNNYPDISLFPKLAEVLGTTVGEMLKGEKSNTEIKTEETVTELIDYTKQLEKKKKGRRILSLVVLAILYSLLFNWSNITVDLKRNPLEFVKVNPETSQLYNEVEQAFPSFIQQYDACSSAESKTLVFDSHIRTILGYKPNATSLFLKFGVLEPSKVNETSSTLWCPLMLEFIPELIVYSNDYPVSKKDADRNELVLKNLSVTEGSGDVDVDYTIFDLSSVTDTTKLILNTQFKLMMNGYLIKGELPGYQIQSPQLLNYTKKVIPQDYLDMVEVNIQALAKALLRAQSRSNQLEVNKANFYAGYMEAAANYPFTETRKTVFEDNQWRLKQTMFSKDTIVTFTTDLNGKPISIEIDRGDQSTTMGGIAWTLQTVAMHRLSYWPFPEGYLDQIFFNLTENKGPWIIEMKEANMSLICTDYLRHYQIKWPN